jgi:hypothetical protein
VNCDKPRDQATKLCSACSGTAASASKEWRDRRKETGTQCMYCPEPRWHKSTSCKWHYVEKIISNFGIGPRHAGSIADKLEDSNFTCFYTGVPLVPGENASLDHVKPRSKFPHLADCVDNLVWCDRSVNNMKTAFEVPDFLAMCRKAIERADKIEAKHIEVSSVMHPITIPPTSVS